MNLFIYEDYNLQLNKPEILLIKEFAELFTLKYNANTDGDKDGRKRLKAMRACTYIYLVYDWKSPYSEYSDSEKVEAALDDSKLSKKDIEDDLILEAAVKYKHLQETRTLKLLNDAYCMIDELRLYFRTTSLQERDPETGKPIHSAKEAMSNLSALGKTVEGLQQLEYMVKKEQEKEKSLRGNAEKGMYD